MAVEGTANVHVVPSEPIGSCFVKSDFSGELYQVDAFVGRCKKNVSLEILKGNLDDYLKALKHALIELINQDYADFVNLSTNLVGMDKSISNLTVPLGQLKEEVHVIRGELDCTVAAIEDKLAERAQLRKKKVCMQHLLNITKSLEKIERLLRGEVDRMGESGSDGTNSDDDSHLIERVASEFNQLQFYVTQSQGHPMVESIRGRIAAITSTLQKKLETAFQDGIETSHMGMLSRVLRTYAIIDKTRDAELLFRQVVVRPYMNQIISESSLSTPDPVGSLEILYGKMLEFISKYCLQMVNITHGKLDTKQTSSVGNSRAAIRGFDFLVNAVWPEVAHLIETKLNSIFAPGNPDAFFKKYTTTMEFVSQFEKHCGSKASVMRLRAHSSYTGFMSRWSLPVYFQIRFQEIVGKFETVLLRGSDGSGSGELQDPLKQFHTPVVSALFWSINRCWEQGVYLAPLCHRFWKLTLQLLSRFSCWLAEELKKEENQEVSSVSDTGSSSVTQAQTASQTQTPNVQAPAATSPLATTAGLVHTLVDTNKFLEKITLFFRTTILPLLNLKEIQDVELLSDALQEACEKIGEFVPEFNNKIIQQIAGKSIQALDAAKNIPRMYRRTNREPPNKASPFVSAAVKPLFDFLSEHSSLVGEQQQRQWATHILQALFIRYSTITTDVLTSIKKTEDSLLRLKRTRKPAGGQGTQAGPGSGVDGAGTITDDDKIRLQFALDVTDFGKIITELGLDPTSSCPAYTEVSSLVQSARSGDTAALTN